MNARTLLLYAMTITLAGTNGYADSLMSGPRYMPRADILPEDYTQSDRVQDYMDLKSYRQYEQREPCQHYRRLPRNTIDSCASTKEEIFFMPVDRTAEQHLSEARLLPIIHSYTILFDFNRSEIRRNEQETINQIIREIDTYHPTQITVTGYTDSSGSVDYNQALSRRREQAVSEALLRRGIENQTLDRNARGEYDQAVETKDGVRNQENRRVVVDFRR